MSFITPRFHRYGMEVGKVPLAFSTKCTLISTLLPSIRDQSAGWPYSSRTIANATHVKFGNPLVDELLRNEESTTVQGKSSKLSVPSRERWTRMWNRTSSRWGLEMVEMRHWTYSATLDEECTVMWRYFSRTLLFRTTYPMCSNCSTHPGRKD